MQKLFEKATERIERNEERVRVWMDQINAASAENDRLEQTEPQHAMTRPSNLEREVKLILSNLRTLNLRLTQAEKHIEEIRYEAVKERGAKAVFENKIVNQVMPNIHDGFEDLSAKTGQILERL